MLRRLFVQNFALIDRVEVEFGPGLNLITGETGAGKSLLVDAIGLILGRRADSSVMLDATQKCIVEAEFQLPDAVLQTLRAELETDAEPADTDGDSAAAVDLDSTLLLRREIVPSGKSRAFVNDTPVTLPVLRSVTARVVDLHGQHEGQRLMDPAVQLVILDNYAGIATQADTFQRDLANLRNLTRELETLRSRADEAKRQQDYAQYQFNELDAAALQPGEDETIEQQLARLQHAEAITETLGRFAYLLEGDESGITLQLKAAVRELERAAAIDNRLAPEIQRLSEARFLLEEVAANLQRLAEETDLDPARVAELTARLDAYNRLKLKFSVRTADELVALREQFAQQLADFSATPERIEALSREQQALAASLAAQGLALEAQRTATAQQLETRINALFAEVGLPKAELQVAVQRLTAPEGLLDVQGEGVNPNLRGINSVLFRIRTNPGTPMGTLQQVASGGEISRVMLAIKTALAEKLALSVLIFDEIDTGISGEVAMKVGRMMHKLAQGHQLLTITHLPQIASRPGRHFFLYKEQVNGRTYSRIRPLDDPARAEEIAKMIGGERVTDSALASARELLGS